MRRGIGLRGYAQQDPLNEFRREAFRLYEELRGLIRHGVASSIFRVTVTRDAGPSGNGSDPAVGSVAGAGRRGDPRRRRGRPARQPPRPAVGTPSAVAAVGGGGTTVLRGGCRPRPSRDPSRESLGDRSSRVPAGSARQRSATGVHAERRADRSQRSVLVRFRRQVQEVPRPLIAPGSRATVAEPEPCAAVRRDLIRLAGAACLGLALIGGYATYRIWAQGQTDEERPADAIVVMGAAQYNGRPSRVFAARLDHAVSLYLAGVAPRLVVTGGKAEGDRTTEAAAGRAFAIGLGVPRGGHPDGGPEPDDARVDPRRVRTCSTPAAPGTRSSCPIVRTCSASCGWPSDEGVTAGVRPPERARSSTTSRARSTPRSTSSVRSRTTS